MLSNNFGIGNREVGMRYWCSELKMMLRVNAIYLPTDAPSGKVVSVRTPGDVHEWDNEWRDYSEGVLMQYTGLKDKNGKEIYEGDITSLHCGVVTFDEGSFGIEYKDRFDEATSCELIFQNKHVEVIGNVFDNPELING